MREILFRGKRLDNGEWVQGVYYRQTEFYGTPQEKHFIIVSTETLQDDGALEYFEVDPATIGQDTGLTDKNGTKIFDGDIVSGYFTFWYDTFHRAFRGGHTYNGVGSVSIGMEASCPRAIIGNIHDNPTLLEEQYHEDPR